MTDDLLSYQFATASECESKIEIPSQRDGVRVTPQVRLAATATANASDSATDIHRASKTNASDSATDMHRASNTDSENETATAAATAHWAKITLQQWGRTEAGTR